MSTETRTEARPLCENLDCSHCGRYDCIKHPDHEEDDHPASYYETDKKPPEVDFSAELGDLITAAKGLLQATQAQWDEDCVLRGYPKYLPDFGEFLCDLQVWHEGIDGLPADWDAGNPNLTDLPDDRTEPEAPAEPGVTGDSLLWTSAKRTEICHVCKRAIPTGESCFSPRFDGVTMYCDSCSDKISKDTAPDPDERPNPGWVKSSRLPEVCPRCACPHSEGGSFDVGGDPDGAYVAQKVACLGEGCTWEAYFVYRLAGWNMIDDGENL